MAAYEKKKKIQRRGREGLGWRLTDVHTVVVPIRPGHGLVDVGVDSRHCCGRSAEMRVVARKLYVAGDNGGGVRARGREVEAVAAAMYMQPEFGFRPRASKRGRPVCEVGWGNWNLDFGPRGCLRTYFASVPLLFFSRRALA